MPTYDFRCPAGHDFERFFGRISTAPGEVECPTCGATAVRQISGGAGLVFKGSGFYITDYGKDGKKDQKPSAAKSEGAKSEGAKSEGGKGEGGKSEGSKGDGGGKGESAAPKSDAPAAKSDAGSSSAKPAAPPKPASGA